MNVFVFVNQNQENLAVADKIKAQLEGKTIRKVIAEGADGPDLHRYKGKEGEGKEGEETGEQLFILYLYTSHTSVHQPTARAKSYPSPQNLPQLRDSRALFLS